MLLECRAMHVSWVVWDEEFDGGIHFGWTPRKCHGHLNETFQSSLQKHTYLIRFCLMIQEMSFLRTTVEYSVNRILKSDAIAFICILPLQIQKYRYWLEILYGCWQCMV